MNPLLFALVDRVLERRAEAVLVSSDPTEAAWLERVDEWGWWRSLWPLVSA